MGGFTYDGAGPDAFFWVGESGAPGRGADTHVLAYPFTGKHFEYEDAETPKLEPGTSYDGSKDIELTLPDGVETTDLKWFSVWCRRFSANFGDLFFPEGFALEGEKPVEATSKDLPPPAAIPGNALDHDHHHHDDDADANRSRNPNQSRSRNPMEPLPQSQPQWPSLCRLSSQGLFWHERVDFSV